MLKQEFGVIVNVWLPPQLTLTEPLGLIVPPLPAEAEIVQFEVTVSVALAEVVVAEHGVLTSTRNWSPLSPADVAGVV